MTSDKQSNGGRIEVDRSCKRRISGQENDVALACVSVHSINRDGGGTGGGRQADDGRLMLWFQSRTCGPEIARKRPEQFVASAAASCSRSD